MGLVLRWCCQWSLLLVSIHSTVLSPRLTETENEAEELPQRSIDEQTSTGCEENLQIGKTWLRNCLTSHPSCRPRLPEPWLPTRLLDVDSGDKPAIRLVLSSSLDIETQYAALSHRPAGTPGASLASLLGVDEIMLPRRQANKSQPSRCDIFFSLDTSYRFCRDLEAWQGGKWSSVRPEARRGSAGR
jgi:hypothetical protein